MVDFDGKLVGKYTIPMEPSKLLSKRALLCARMASLQSRFYRPTFRQRCSDDDDNNNEKNRKEILSTLC